MQEEENIMRQSKNCSVIVREKLLQPGFFFNFFFKFIKQVFLEIKAQVQK